MLSAGDIPVSVLGQITTDHLLQTTLLAGTFKRVEVMYNKHESSTLLPGIHSLQFFMVFHHIQIRCGGQCLKKFK
jgi:hypothetical protein